MGNAVRISACMSPWSGDDSPLPNLAGRIKSKSPLLCGVGSSEDGPHDTVCGKGPNAHVGRLEKLKLAHAAP